MVLLDIHLGKKNGLTLAHWARKQKHLAHILILAMTGDESLKDKKSTLDAGCDACLVKPFYFKALREFWLYEFASDKIQQFVAWTHSPGKTRATLFFC